MSKSETVALVAAAMAVVSDAKVTLSGVGAACFPTQAEQDGAITAARNKLAAAEKILEDVVAFEKIYGHFS